MIKTILVDDHQLILAGLSQMLADEKEIKIMAAFTHAIDAYEYLQNHTIDIVITDLDMPHMSGIDLIRKIRSTNPKQKIIVLSMIDQQSIINRMIKYDVNGYLMKNELQTELSKAIHTVYTGQLYYNKEIKKVIFQSPESKVVGSSRGIPKLSMREKEVLQLIMKEMTGKEIAEKLFISPGTVITHRKHLLSKLEVKNTAGLVRRALELGLV